MPVMTRHGGRELLPLLFKLLGYLVGVEVGTRSGEFAKTILDENLETKLWCVDPYREYLQWDFKTQNYYRKQAAIKLKDYDVEFVFKDSMEAVIDFPDTSFDFVYIDGAHDFDNVCMDLICWAKKVKNGGIIALHDYIDSYNNGVVKCVNAYTHCHNIRPWFITRDHIPTAFWVKDEA